MPFLIVIAWPLAGTVQVVKVGILLVILFLFLKSGRLTLAIVRNAVKRLVRTNPTFALGRKELTPREVLKVLGEIPNSCPESPHDPHQPQPNIQPLPQTNA